MSNATKAVPKWRRFEELAAHIHQTLSPASRIEQNARIRGRITDVLREIDIAVWPTQGDVQCLVAIDCKDHKAKVDVKQVEAFMGLVDDIGATAGVLVSAMGFTRAAKRRGEVAGLRLLTLVDAESETWPCVVELPAMADVRRLEAFRFRIRSSERRELGLERLNSREVFRADGSSMGTLGEIVVRRWNDGLLPLDVGEHHHQIDEPTFLLADGALWCVELEVALRVARSLYSGYIPVEKLQ